MCFFKVKMPATVTPQVSTENIKPAYTPIITETRAAEPEAPVFGSTEDINIKPMAGAKGISSLKIPTEKVATSTGASMGVGMNGAR